MVPLDPIVRLEKVYKEYRMSNALVSPVLFDVSLCIHAGEFTALVGPSGSGKSTLMNIIGCLDVPTSGEYFFRGESVGSLSSDALAELRSAEISFVFQSFHLLQSKDVFQNVMLPLLYRRTFTGDYHAYVEDALAKADLDKELWHRRPNQLSGGQRQRVAIARALVARPSLLLADEPTGNLDSKTGGNVLDALRRLHTDLGTTILIVTHDHAIVSMVDRVITIKDGRITEGV